ncbi:hypothetical protein [Myroides odoratus]|uniref:hypothetical protein n=1 Tax=Myroides odoratus TaxID=256 RepID=UPI000765A486|nr:hypothetical protein [Myroides odoratus]
MSTGNKKEQGVEATSVLTEEKKATENGELLDHVVEGLEAVIAEKDTKISELETEKIELQGKLEKAEAKIVELEKKLPKAVKVKKNEVVIRFTLSPAGKFKLPYNVGQEVALHEEVAAEIVEAKYAEYVK